MAYGNFNQRRSFAPVKVGEEFDVKIEAVGEKGDGICKKDGFVLFVPGAKEGDEVKVRVTKVLRRVGFAEIIGSEVEKAKTEKKPRKAKKEEESEEKEEQEETEEQTQDYEGQKEFKEPEEFEDSEDFGEE